MLRTSMARGVEQLYKCKLRQFLGAQNFQLPESQLGKNFHSRDYSSIKPTSTARTHLVDSNNVFMSPFNDVEMPSDFVHQFIWRNVDRWWNKTALVCGASGRSYSYAELRTLSGKFATSLRRKKLMPGDTLAVALANIPEVAIVVLGASEAGVKVTLLNPTYKSYEMKGLIERAGASAVITTSDKYSQVMEALQDNNNVRLPPIIIPTGSEPLPINAINFRDLVASGIEEFEKIGEKTSLDSNNDTFALPFSSGTTDLPKAVELSHRNIVCNITQYIHQEFYIAEPATDDFQEILPLFLPLSHMYGLSCVLLTHLCLGGKMICMPEFTAANFLDIIERNKVTILKSAPPVIQLMANDSRFNAKNLGNLKSITNGAAPLGSELLQRLTTKIGSHCEMTQGYGLTETSPVITRSKHLTSDASVGPLLVNTQLRIVGGDDDAGCNLGMYKTGEVVVRGPQVMKGYYKNPAATENSMDGDWFKTGDLGHVDSKGNLYLTGRIKELIKVKGFQVAPAELENVIFGHQKVADAAIIGVTHETFGEIPKAFVVPKPNVKLTEEEIKNYVAERLSTHKHIGHVQFIDEIPKTAAGKILRRELCKL